MATFAWMEWTLQRLESQGQELLERANRNSTDWNSVASYQPYQPSPSFMKEAPSTFAKEARPTFGQEARPTFAKEAPNPVWMSKPGFDGTFERVAEITAETTHHCQNFYTLGGMIAPTDIERNHVSRYHAPPPPVAQKIIQEENIQPEAEAPPVVETVVQVVERTEEEFLIDVSPGLYAITTHSPPLPEQTQVVRVQAGESATLTFDL